MLLDLPKPAGSSRSHTYLACQMFKSFEQKSAVKSDKLYRMTLHVGRGTNTEMPANLIGAYVPVFVGADSREAAAFKAVADVRIRGFNFIDIADGQIHELDPYRWDAFVIEAWPDFVTEFPTQSKMIEALRANFVFIGPYAAYETQTPQTR
ncbi:hypothetical protein OU994_16800 [Pseudoduganella sp. SL102]|uniref:hypothetical protein n=1 Tax=Pseudoduganella sp. SL102 TaxID=2995154 RepID=UPI00248C2FF3|nr:hypothetical protein [Pseudoduganella sp. SL102]WBR99982.1 hypothetical protein OU994_16800 [Pseudoduganella sp. SL102]